MFLHLYITEIKTTKAIVHQSVNPTALRSSFKSEIPFQLVCYAYHDVSGGDSGWCEPDTVFECYVSIYLLCEENKENIW